MYLQYVTRRHLEAKGIYEGARVGQEKSGKTSGNGKVGFLEMSSIDMS